MKNNKDQTRLINERFRDVLINSNYTDLRIEASEKLFSNDPDNVDLYFILRYCPDEHFRNLAGEKLLARRETNESELNDIMAYCTDDDLRNRVGFKIVEFRPSVVDLNFILQNCTDEILLERAARKLLIYAV